MEKDSSEMHSDDGKANLEKNRKRTVKTHAQVQALEKFYEEYKYPTEEMKLQLAESIGLTEKQVSGWFCHRRLKDKKLTNGENHATRRQDRSSGVIQDHGSGHRQDSCGSTKQGNERNFDTKEVESGQLTPKEFSAANVTHVIPAEKYYHANDPSSGSSSSLRDMPNHQSVAPFSAARQTVPRFSADIKGLKTRPGPSGYLKVKGRVENVAITAVKRQLGKHYREDGPPLGVEFEPLPPGAFESVMQEPIEGTHYIGETVFPASADVAKVHQDPKFAMGYEYNSSLPSYKNDGTSFKMGYGCDPPDSYIHKKSRPRSSWSSGDTGYPGSNYSVQFGDAPDSHVSGGHSRDKYGTKLRPDVEFTRIDSISNHPHLQSYNGKVKVEQFCKYNSVGREDPLRENTSIEYPNLTMKRKECHLSGDALLSQQTIKNGSLYPDKRAVDENRVKFPFNRDLHATKRVKEEYTPQQHLKTSSVVDKLPQTNRAMRSRMEMQSSFSEEEEEDSAETNSSVD